MLEEKSILEENKGKILTGVFFSRIATSVLQEDGYWKLLDSIEQALSEEYGSWSFRRKTIMALDRDLIHAKLTTDKAIDNLLKECKHNLFAIENFDGEEGTYDKEEGSLVNVQDKSN